MDITKPDYWQSSFERELMEREDVQSIQTFPGDMIDPPEYELPKAFEADIDNTLDVLEKIGKELAELTLNSPYLRDDPWDEYLVAEYLIERIWPEEVRKKLFERKYPSPKRANSRG